MLAGACACACARTCACVCACAGTCACVYLCVLSTLCTLLCVSHCPWLLPLVCCSGHVPHVDLLPCLPACMPAGTSPGLRRTVIRAAFSQRVTYPTRCAQCAPGYPTVCSVCPWLSYGVLSVPLVIYLAIYLVIFIYCLFIQNVERGCSSGVHTPHFPRSFTPCTRGLCFVCVYGVTVVTYGMCVPVCLCVLVGLGFCTLVMVASSCGAAAFI